MPAIACPGDDSLARFAGGLAAPSEAAALRSHAEGCPGCAGLIESLVMSPVTARVNPGLEERYELGPILGMGGMGTVHEARRRADGKRVAVKILRSTVIDRGSRRRLAREARILSTLASPHVVRVLEAGDFDEERPFLVMELLEGKDLQSWIDVHGRLPPEVVVQALRDACAALAEAHAHGIVHRDLKPANLFLARGDGNTARLVVLDFGLGTAPAAERAAASLRTVEGALLGTPVYMAPEQVRDPAAVDARSDVYALGATAYALLTGRPPFAGKNVAVLLADVLTRAPTTPVEDAPPALVAIVERCMDKDPAARFPTCAALDDVLAALVTPLGRPPSWLGPIAVMAGAGAAAGIAARVVAALVHS